MADSTVDGTNIPPVYIVQRDLLALTNDISTTAICLSLNDIAENCAVGAQLQLDGIWRIYINSIEARDLLVNTGLTVCGRPVPIHNMSPSIHSRRSLEKVVLKDLPLSLTNLQVMQQILKMFPNLKVTSKVQCARDVLITPDGKRNYSPFLTGDRFFYIESPVSFPLPKTFGIEGFRCRVWHYSQKHFCTRCDKPDHATDDFSCPAYRDPSTISSFRSRFHPLCNMYLCSVEYNDKQFKSAEHLYGYRKCVFADEAALSELVFSAPDAFAAKRLTQTLDPTKLKDWHKARLDIMKEVLIAKASSVPKFRQALIDTGDNIIAESTDDPYWGCGFANEAVASSIDPTFYKGSNMLGNLLMTVRDIVKNDDCEATSDSDGSSSSDGSDSDKDEEMHESPPTTEAVTTSTTSPPTPSVLSTPQDVYPIFTGGTQAVSTPKIRPTARLIKNDDTPSSRTASQKRGRSLDSSVTENEQSTCENKTIDSDAVTDKSTSSQQAVSTKNIPQKSSSSKSSKLKKKKSKKARK